MPVQKTRGTVRWKGQGGKRGEGQDREGRADSPQVPAHDVPLSEPTFRVILLYGVEGTRNGRALPFLPSNPCEFRFNGTQEGVVYFSELPLSMEAGDFREAQ